MSLILNKHIDSIPHDAIYIGRPSKWGNPTKIDGRHTRRQAIEHFERWLKTQPDLLAQIYELTDRELVCWCAPRLCHGNVLSAVADMEPEEIIAWMNDEEATVL